MDEILRRRTQWRRRRCDAPQRAAYVLLGVVALMAYVPPALRALRVDPVDGLRAE